MKETKPSKHTDDSVKKVKKVKSAKTTESSSAWDTVESLVRQFESFIIRL